MTDRDDILKRLDEMQSVLQTHVTNQIVETYKLLTPPLDKKRLEILKNLHDIKQTTGLIARRLAHKGAPIRCVFLVHMAEAWNVLAPVYEAMRKSDDFKPIAITCPRAMPPDWQYAAEDDNHEELARLGVPHLRFNMNENEALDLLKTLAPDLLFRQQPWDKMIQGAFATMELSFTRLCYIPYGYMAVKRFFGDPKVPEGNAALHTDQYFHRACWRIFCETEMHLKIHAENGARRGENVVFAGYPKFDDLLKRGRAAPHWPIAAKDGKKRYRVIWAPHHSIGSDWLGFGTFMSTHRDMLDWAKRDGDTEFVLKPHPHLWGKITGSYKTMTQEQLDEWIAAWKALPNAALLESGDYGPLFAASDVMITDGISFLSEYQIFEKPLIYVDSGRNTGFNEAGAALVESANTVKTIAEARALTDKLRKGEPDPMKEAQKKTLQRIMPWPEKSAEKILDTIREGLKKEEDA